MKYLIDFEIWTKTLSKIYFFLKIGHKLNLLEYQIEVIISHLIFKRFQSFFNIMTTDNRTLKNNINVIDICLKFY